MMLIQLLLPTAIPPSTDPQSGKAALAETRGELAEMFEGLTAYVRSPAKGMWTAPDGHTAEDEVMMVEVVTESFDRHWWRSYAAKLAKRFRQEAIHVRALPIETPDEEE